MLTRVQAWCQPASCTPHVRLLQTLLHICSALDCHSGDLCTCMQVVDLLAQHLAQWARSPVLPEAANLAAVQLRRLLKQLPAERFRTRIRALVVALEQSSAAVLAARSKQPFRVGDAAAVKAFQAALQPEQVGTARLSESCLHSGSFTGCSRNEP